MDTLSSTLEQPSIIESPHPDPATNVVVRIARAPISRATTTESQRGGGGWLLCSAIAAVPFRPTERLVVCSSEKRDHSKSLSGAARSCLYSRT